MGQGLSCSDGASSRMSRKCCSVFELEMMSITKKLDPVVNEFKDKIQKRINTAVKPSMEKGAKEGQEAAFVDDHVLGLQKSPHADR